MPMMQNCVKRHLHSVVCGESFTRSEVDLDGGHIASDFFEVIHLEVPSFWLVAE